MDVVTSLILTLNTGLGAGVLISEYTEEFYAQLSKPWFSPPSWVFGIVWPILYVITAVGIAGSTTYLTIIYAIQLALNFWWSIVFFKYKQIYYALAIIIPLLILNIIITAYVGGKFQTIAFGLYTAWLLFATILNLSVKI